MSKICQRIPLCSGIGTKDISSLGKFFMLDSKVNFYQISPVTHPAVQREYEPPDYLLFPFASGNKRKCEIELKVT